MTVTVWPIAAVTGAPAYSGRMLRQAQSVFLAGATAARPLGARSGVRPGTSTTTCTATSTVWTIGPHAGVMDVEVAAECGPYAYAVDAAITGSMTAAHATLPRVDILWMRVDDPPEDGTAVPQVVGGYTAGTAATTPAAPATPARCMVLGWVNVPASGGGSPTVTWKATYASAAVLVPLVFTDVGLATSDTIDVATTNQRTITDPFGPGRGYRAKVTYVLGSVTAAAGVYGYARITINGVAAIQTKVSSLSSATSYAVVDVPAGGTTTVQTALVAKSATMATDALSYLHAMITEVTPL